MSNHRFSEFGTDRPLLVIGNGVRLSGAVKECRKLVRHMGIPVVSSWTGADIIPTDDPLYIGRFGLFGDRAANLAVQNADFILVIGCRLSIPQIGHRCEMFAREAKIVMVDCDQAELDKPTLRIFRKIREDAGTFIRKALEIPSDDDDNIGGWVQCCQRWKARYTMDCEPRDGAGFNSFHFIKHLSEALDHDATVVTDMGTSFTCTFQAANIKMGQRWITASGHAPMGYGLPAAIGAACAMGRRVVCITGDGGLQLNIQELAMVAGEKMPITIFVLNNGGYLTMKHTQRNHFGRMVGAHQGSGLHMPDLGRIAGAYGIRHATLERGAGLEQVKVALDMPTPCIVEVMMDHDQPLIPRVQTTRENGVLRGGLLEDMWPYLPRDEFNMNMIGATPE